MPEARRRPIVSALLAVIGGGVVIAGSLLVWLDVGGGVSVGTTSITGTPKGSELLLGRVALGAGIAVAVFGLFLLVFGRARKVVGLLVLIGGIVAIATAAYVASAPKDRYVDFAADTAAPAGQVEAVRTSLSNLFGVSSLTADPGVGSYVAIGGGAVAALGGLGALFGRRKLKVDQMEPADEPVEAPVELEQITDAAPEQQPASPVHETPEPEAEQMEESAPAEEPPVAAEPPHEEPPAEAPRNRDEWNF